MERYHLLMRIDRWALTEAGHDFWWKRLVPRARSPPRFYEALPSLPPTNAAPGQVRECNKPAEWDAPRYLFILAKDRRAPINDASSDGDRGAASDLGSSRCSSRCFDDDERKTRYSTLRRDCDAAASLFNEPRILVDAGSEAPPANSAESPRYRAVNFMQLKR